MFKLYHQPDSMDCGPTCLRMVAKHYGKIYSLPKLRELSHINKEGVSLHGISHAAEKIGFRTIAVKVGIQQLIEDAPLPCILHWNQNHFVVLYKITSPSASWRRGVSLSADKAEGGADTPSLLRRGTGGGVFHIADPGSGKHKLSQQAFLKSWASTTQNTEPQGIALLLEPTPKFYEEDSEITSSAGKARLGGFSYLFKYLWQYKKLLVQLLLGFLLGSIFQLIFPLETGI